MLIPYFCPVKIHEKYISRCLELAKNSLGLSFPNPMVGCVIVYNSQIIGEGFTSSFGGAHAEVNAINAVADKSLLMESTLYVSLEPCAHFGKTPPCTNLIIEYKIPKVVIGVQDPYKEVAGKGIQLLKKSGCEVTVGILENDCQALNNRFFTFYKKKRPYIILKWAESSDGFMDIERDQDTEKKPHWISNAASRQLVHKWRSEEQAVLVGTKTVLNDNPRLNVRSYIGKEPIRVVLDRKLRIPHDYAIFDGSNPTVVLNESRQGTYNGIDYIKIDFNESLAKQVCNVLYNYGIQSLLVEGGRQTIETFIDSEVWDEARIFKGIEPIKNGLSAPIIEGNLLNKFSIKGDVLSIIKNNTPR